MPTALYYYGLCCQTPTGVSYSTGGLMHWTKLAARSNGRAEPTGAPAAKRRAAQTCNGAWHLRSRLTSLLSAAGVAGGRSWLLIAGLGILVGAAPGSSSGDLGMEVTGVVTTREGTPCVGCEVTAIGDRADTDILGGKRAGLTTICVLSGSSDRAEAEAYGSDMIFDDIAHLLETWRHL